jgi:DNA recombination protein RmuC
MGRFRERVLDLQRHFGQANQDIEKILTSSERIAQRGNKIENLDFEDDAPKAVEGTAAPLSQPPHPNRSGLSGGGTAAASVSRTCSPKIHERAS